MKKTSYSNNVGAQDTSESISCLSLFLYFTFICVLGLTLLCTLIFGLTLSRDTISNNMLTYIPYRIVLSTCIFIQMAVWIVCLYSKRAMDPDAAVWGYVTMGIVTCSWVGLTTILTGTVHFIFVSTFIIFFFISMLIICNLTWQDQAGKVLRISMAFIIVCAIAMTILYNEGEFYIMEHVAFISYSLVFMAFFIVHTPSHWGTLPDSYPLECESETHGIEWQYQNRFQINGLYIDSTKTNTFNMLLPVIRSQV